MIFKIGNHISLEDAKLDKQFRYQYFTDSIKPLRHAFFLLIFLYSSFGFLDVWMAPSEHIKFWIIRLSVSMLMLILVFLSYRQSFRQYWQIATSFCYIIGGLGIILMLKELPSAYTYNSGLMLVFISGYLFIKLRFIYAFVSSLLILISYNLIIGLSIENVNLILINNNFFFIGANIVGGFISYNLEQNQRKMFLNANNLTKQQHQLERSNRLLEFKVKRRTESLLKRNDELAKIIYEKEPHKLENTTQNTNNQAILNKIKSSYLEKIGHNLRTPLNAISGFSALISDPNIEDGERIKYNDFLAKGVSQLNSLIKEIQIIGQLGTQNGAIHQETISPHHLLHEIRNSIQNQFTNPIDFCIEEPPFKVLSFIQNKKNIQLILELLIKDVLCEFHTQNITVGYQLIEDTFHFFILYPTPNNNSILELETLTIIHYLLSQINGTISQSPSNNHTQKIMLCFRYEEGKISIHDLSTEKPINRAEKRIASADKQSILIAEDNDLNFNFFNIILGNSYIVYRAKNGVEAIEMFIKVNPNLILMDIKMPIMGGLDAAKQIKCLSLNTPIIALTAFELDPLEAIHFSDCLIKPISADVLLSKVSKQIAPLD